MPENRHLDATLADADTASSEELEAAAAIYDRTTNPKGRNKMDTKAKISRTHAALDECGIGHDIDDKLRGALRALDLFLESQRVKIRDQILHLYLVNIPAGIIERSTTTGADSIGRALPGICGAFLRWDVGAAIELAADILEDVNAHDEARQVRAMAG